ncbi:MAG: hypothetical protein Q8K37_07750, partial [Alphaproteobacteria bacterium]|nr:hypothetical protein [Alphaproteobacteria bacterium]
MKKLLIYIIALTIHMPISWSSDSEEELPMDISEYANSFLTSSLADILGNEQPNNNAKINNDTLELFSYPYEKEYLQPKSPPFAGVFDDISHHSHDKYNLGFEDPILSYTTEEMKFFDLNKEQNVSISNANICITFKECLLNGFSTYLSLKRKLLYIHKFMPSDFRELKNEMKFHEKVFYPQEDI